ncbi:hypothetical protein EP7_004494 [Isosphaeraceae bacterium EP7]
MRFISFHFSMPIKLAVVFVSVFIALAVKTWGGFFFVHGLVIAGIFLVLGYLLLLCIMRQYREQQEGTGGPPHS